jgi:hypothetical protein
MGKRIYVYRHGDSDSCVLTAVKGDPRLPPADAPGYWRFWMQIGPQQAQNGRYGFDIRSAVSGLSTDGYYLFTGSPTLLRSRRSRN